MKLPVFLVGLCIFLSCGSSNHGMKYGDIKQKIESNYDSNEAVFIEIYNTASHFQSIKTVSFSNENVTVSYLNNNTVKRLDNKHLLSDEVKSVMYQDSLSLEDLTTLKTKLNQIHCSEIRLIKDQVEIPFLKWNDLDFYYKVFPSEFDSIQIEHFNKFLVQKNIGGILGNRVLWYYK